MADASPAVISEAALEARSEQGRVTLTNLTPLHIRAGELLLQPLDSKSWQVTPGAETQVAAIALSNGSPSYLTTIRSGATFSAIYLETESVRRRPGQQPVGDSVREWNASSPVGHIVPGIHVTNKTPWFLDAVLLEEKGERKFGRIAPGETWSRQVGPNQFWQFRTTLLNEVAGALISAFQGPISLEITDEFRQRWQAYQREGSSARLRLIGEVRQRTPGPEAPEFLQAATVRQEFSKDWFNGLQNCVVRDVEIAGVLLQWSGANKTLAEYYGEGVTDVRSLTICADRMEVADRLRFPGTDVTIHARELVFEGAGCIDTTPIAISARARSEYLTADPENATNTNAPADADGRPTYKAADGEKGQRAGNITLHVRQLLGQGGEQTRFICRGARGQAAEPGGLKKYQAAEGHSKQYGPLPTFTVDAVRQFVSDNSVEKDMGRFRWPENEVYPALLNAGKVAAVKVLVYCDDIGPTVFTPIAWAERGFLPGREYQHWWNPRAAFPLFDHSDNPELDGKPNPFDKPCHGRAAYPGGWPGDGGDGGTVTSTVAGAGVSEAWCDTSAGLPGEHTPPQAGDAAPGPDKLYSVQIRIVKHSAVESKRGPSAEATEIARQAGVTAKGREYAENAGPASQAGYERRVSKAQRGAVANVSGNRLSWAHPAAVASVLNYARTAYRNGFREQASRALDAYFALLDGNPAELAASMDLRLAFSSITALRGRLAQNLDYYGNPVGWVPRLNALSNLDVLKAVRKAAYGTFYFADKMLRDYDSLDRVQTVSRETSTALKEELQQAQDGLAEAYRKIPEAMGLLNNVQQELVPVHKQLEGLRDRALQKSRDKLAPQRIFNAGMQILGGIAKALPVGQPFVGLAGSVLGAAGEFDWNAEDPAKSARSGIKNISAAVTDFTENKKEEVAALVSGKGGGKPELVTKLTRQLEDEEKEPGEKKAKVQTALEKLLEDSQERIRTGLAEVQKEIAEIQKHRHEEDEAAAKRNTAARGFEKLLQAKQRELTEQRLTALRGNTAVFLKEQAELAKEARLAAQSDSPTLKTIASKVAQPRADLEDGLKGALKTAKEPSSDQKKLVKAREETANRVMSSLEGAGAGIGMIGNAIVSLAAPLSADDPALKRLTEQMLDEDPELREKGKELRNQMLGILDRKKAAGTELMHAQGKASSCLSTISNSLATLAALSRQRQSLNSGLDPGVREYLAETRGRAKDALAESIYWFVKSYQYENLADVEDTFSTSTHGPRN